MIDRTSLNEPVFIVDTFVSGIGMAEELAPNLYRVTFYAENKSIWEDEKKERQIVARFIVTGSALAAISTDAAEIAHSNVASTPIERPAKGERLQ